MQFDRMMMRQAVRLAPKLLAQATQKLGQTRAAATDGPPLKPAEKDLRGSGSWANEWAGAKAAIARTRERSKLIGPGAKAKADPVDVIAEGTISRKALLNSREVKLFHWIADRLETAAPTCDLNAGIALSAFLHSEVPGALDGLVADMAIVDETGQVLCVLIRDRRDDPGRQIRLIDALIDSDMPTIDLPDRLSLSKLWDDIARYLPA